MHELTFYEDSQFDGRMSGYDRTKLKLDLNSPSAISGTKRSLLSHVSNTSTPLLLQSPDLMMLKLRSPELERIILENQGLITTTPTPTDGGDPSSTDEQQEFARGFIEALQKLHEKEVPGGRTVELTNDRRHKLKSIPTTKVSVSRGVIESTSDKAGRSSYVKSDSTNPSISSVAATSSSTFSFVNESSAHKSDCGRAVPRTDTAHYTGIITPSSTTISFPTGSTSSNSYEQSCRRLPIPMANVTTSQDTAPLVSAFDNKAGIASSTIMSGTQALQQQRADSHIRHLPSAQPPAISAPVSMSLDDEAQIVPSSVPIDLDMQEAIKHERKKLRNRLAAQRCRKRKIEREEVLKIKVKELKAKNSELTSTASELRLQVCELKQKVMNHVNQGCQVFVPQSSTSD